MNSDYSNNINQVEIDYDERIDMVQGNYIVASERMDELLRKENLKVTGLEVKPGELTTLYGWFERPVKFCGFLENGAVFFLGQGEADLFTNGGFYYDVTYVIEPGRLFKCYNPDSGRDYYLRQKNGKYYWN